MSLKKLVDELMSLNDEALAQRVIDNDDVQWCLSELQDILAADVEPVVRCRDCIYFRRNEVFNSAWCSYYAGATETAKNGYCYHAIRKGNK